MTTPKLLSEEETRQRLYDLFGQNFLDGDETVDWRASTIDATSVKEYIDDFVSPLISQQKQLYANEMLESYIGWIDRNHAQPISDDRWSVAAQEIVAKGKELAAERTRNNQGKEE